MSRVPRPPKRRFAVVTKRGAGCDGRADIAGERYRCGRRRRVVLIPRRWDQVLRDEFAGRRRLASPVLRGERAISRNTIAQGVPDRFGSPVVTTLVCFSFSHTRLRVRLSARHSLRPLFSEGQRIAKPGREIAPRGAESVPVCQSKAPRARTRGEVKHFVQQC